MKKKKIFIISAILVVIVSAGIGAYLLLKPEDVKEPDVPKFPNVTDKEEVKNEVQVPESIEASLGSKKLELKDFGFKEEETGEIKYYLENKLDEKTTFEKVGTYKVEIIVDTKNYSSSVIVVDKEAPKLKLKELSIKVGETYKLKDFVTSCSDNSKEDCILSYVKDTMGKYTKANSYVIEIIAKDKSGNEISEKTKLTIVENKVDSPNNTTNNNQTTTPSTNQSQNKPQPEVPAQNNQTNTTAPTTDKITEANRLATANYAQVEAIVAETNKLRAEVGLPALKISTSLTKAAMVRAIEISSKNNFSHTRPDGSKFSTIFKELNISYSVVGENLAAGRSTAALTVSDWKNSEGHYKNIIDARFNQIGVGYINVPGSEYTNYWVQLFSN